MATHDGNCSFSVIGSATAVANNAINIGSISFTGTCVFATNIDGFVKNASAFFNATGTISILYADTYSSCANIQLPDIDNFICLENCICHNIGC
jgi:hypothetical protein